MATSADPRIAAARAFGVDLSLMQSILRLTPAERLLRLDEAAASVAELRVAMRETTLPDRAGSSLGE